MASLLGVAAADGQSTTSGGVAGTVIDTGGRPVARALATLSGAGSSASYEAMSGSGGSFVIGLIPPGTYELRVEALGYQPLLARGLIISSGEQATLSLQLTPAAPPVISVDTITLAGSESGRFRSAGVRFGSSDIEGLPDRYGDLASLAALSPAFDRSLGMRGLPGDETLIVADGLPFYRAHHPTSRSEQLPDALFPRSALAGLTALPDAADIEWAGAAGGYVTASTRSAISSGGIDVNAAYSGDPMWSSKRLDITTPSLSSVQGGISGVVELGPRAQLLVSGEGTRQETPLTPRITDALAVELAGLDADLLGSLTAPAVSRYGRYSGLARLDVQRNPTSRLFFRGAGALSRREFSGSGPVSTAGPVAPAEESQDFSSVFGLITRQSPNLTFEIRAGFSASSRDFGPSIDGVPPAFLVDSGMRLGDVAGVAGISSRSDLILAPLAHYSLSSGTLKFGINARATSHTMGHSSASLGDFVYPDAAGLLAGQGFGISNTAPEQSFTTQEYGLFAQYSSTVAPGVRVAVGGRVDTERFGSDGRDMNANWLAASGLRTDDLVEGLVQFGARGSLSWVPSATGGTRISVEGSLHEGDLDPSALYQVLSQDISGIAMRYQGTGLDWPAPSPPTVPGGGYPTLTMLGPDTRAPRTVGMRLAVTQRASEGLTLFAEAATRRTDFLLRRRNLNLPIAAQATDQNGRSIFGSLTQDGSLVATTAPDARRFAGFADIWALDPDGWSEYLGITGGFEHAGSALDLYASYTYSETTDNWVGANGGAIGGMLAPLLPRNDPAEKRWSDGVSDFDAPHRLVGTGTVRVGLLAISGIYRFASGAPFTPRFRLGVDANGDGSIRNDVAYVPGVAELAPLLSAWPCLDAQADGFAVRNSCRGADRHSVDVRVAFRLGRIGRHAATLTLDAFNLVEERGGVVDDALWLVDPTSGITTSPDGSVVTVPYTLNPGFGNVLYPSSAGRMLRVGVRVGS